MIALRVLWALVATLVQFVLLDLPLSLLGLVLIPLALAFKAYGTSSVGLDWDWRLMWLYQNDEDGIDGGGWSETLAQRQWRLATTGWPRWWRIFVWSALRNRVANLRSVPVLSPLFRPERVKAQWNGKKWAAHDPAPPNWPDAYVAPAQPGAWAVVSMGLAVGVTYMLPRWLGSKVLRFGWNLRPGDANGAAWIANRLPRARIVASIGST